MEKFNEYKNIALLFVLSSLWALHFSLVKLVEADDSPLTILVSLLALFTVRLIRRRKEKKSLKIQELELLQSELTEVAAVEVFGSMDSPVVVANESYFEKDDNENDNTS